MIIFAGLADGFEQMLHALEIDAIALLEIELGFARHHAGEMEDHVRPRGEQLRGDARRRQIVGARIDLARKPGRLLRRDHVGQRELVDGLAVQAAVLGQPLGQLAADHARRAGDENVHVLAPAIGLTCHCRA